MGSETISLVSCHMTYKPPRPIALSHRITYVPCRAAMAPWLLRYPRCPKRALQFSLCFIWPRTHWLVATIMWLFHISAQTRGAPLKKNLNASRPSEHPPVRGKNVKTFRWDHRLQKENLFMAINGFPDVSNIGSTVI